MQGAGADKLLMLLVGARGFEPPTSRSQTERTTRLCYAPKVDAHSKSRGRDGQASTRFQDLTRFTRAEEFFCAHQRTGAVADEVFDGVGEFGEGLVVAVGNEEGVVAEAASATGRERDRAL